jgi:hypothetical protein
MTMTDPQNLQTVDAVLDALQMDIENDEDVATSSALWDRLHELEARPKPKAPKAATDAAKEQRSFRDRAGKIREATADMPAKDRSVFEQDANYLELRATELEPLVQFGHLDQDGLAEATLDARIAREEAKEQRDAIDMSPEKAARREKAEKVYWDAFHAAEALEAEGKRRVTEAAGRQHIDALVTKQTNEVAQKQIYDVWLDRIMNDRTFEGWEKQRAADAREAARWNPDPAILARIRPFFEQRMDAKTDEVRRNMTGNQGRTYANVDLPYGTDLRGVSHVHNNWPEGLEKEVTAIVLGLGKGDK